MVKYILKSSIIAFTIIVFGTPQVIATDSKDLKILQLEALLQTYIEEIKELKSQLKELKSKVKNLPEVTENTLLNSNCKSDLRECKRDELCALATYTLNNQPRWEKGLKKAFADEARRRNLTCGIFEQGLTKTNNIEESIVWPDASECLSTDGCPNVNKELEKTSASVSTKNTQQSSSGLNYSKTECENNIQQCKPAALISKDLCTISTITINRQKQWKLGWYTKFVEEAKSRNLSCGVKVDSKQKLESTKSLSILELCENNIQQCKPAALISKDLCTISTITINRQKQWKLGWYTKFVEEAKSRNLSCGVTFKEVAIDRKEKEVRDEEEKQKLRLQRDDLLTESLKFQSDQIEDRKIARETEKKRLAEKKAKQEAAAKARIAKETACSTNPWKCNDQQLCRHSTNYKSGKYFWKNSDSFVAEAKIRGLDCIKMFEIKPKCVNSMTCEVKTFCANALDSETGKWIGDREYTKAAIRRGLTCGSKKLEELVCGDPQFSQNIKAPGRVFHCSDQEICKMGTIRDDDGFIRWNTSLRTGNFVSEAKARGIDCGTSLAIVNDTEVNRRTEESDNTFLSTLPIKNLNSIYRRCSTSVKNCSNIDLCSLSTMIVNGKVVRLPKNDDFYKKGIVNLILREAEKRELTCAVGKKWSANPKDRIFIFATQYQACFTKEDAKIILYDSNFITDVEEIGKNKRVPGSKLEIYENSLQYYIKNVDYFIEVSRPYSDAFTERKLKLRHPLALVEFRLAAGEYKKMALVECPHMYWDK